MNFPQHPAPGGFPPQAAPGGFPPQQQFGAPQPQQQFGAPPQPYAAPGQAAAANLFSQFLAAPPRARVNRARPADGMNVVRFTPGCKVDYSSKDGQAYVLIEYQVVESTVAQNAQGIFGHPMKLVTRNNIQDLAEIAKTLFGVTGIQQFQQQGQGNTPQAMADIIINTLKSGNWYGYVQTRRSQKQVQTVGYEQAFVNNDFLFFAQQPFTLAQIQQHMQQMQPTQQMPSAPAPQPQQQYAQAPQHQMPAPPQPQQQFAQAPQQAWPQPQAPAPQPQQAWPQAPAPQLQAPQPQAWPQSPPMHVPTNPAPPAFPQR